MSNSWLLSPESGRLFLSHIAHILIKQDFGIRYRLSRVVFSLSFACLSVLNGLYGLAGCSFSLSCSGVPPGSKT